MTTTTYFVKGMTCVHCVNAVSGEMAKVPGVSEVEGDLSTGAVTVTSSAPLAALDVVVAVEAAGYELVGTEDDVGTSG